MRDRQTTLVRAARAYGEALKKQHAASTAAHRARHKPLIADQREREHSKACDDLDRAEHELLVTAAVISGFSRRAAKRSV